MVESSAADALTLSDHRDAHNVAVATRTLALLNEQADSVSAELKRLRQDLADEQRDASGMRSTQLLEANEQLMLAALHAQSTAETAASSLDELARSSQRDPLTGTPNRALMLDRLETAIVMARRHGTLIAVLFLDMDDFKHINDKLGHAVGDEVLQLVARRLESIVRESDTVSRHGGDEFLVLLAEISQASDAALIAGKMLSTLAAPSLISGHVFNLSVSMGIAVYPQDGEDVATLIHHADTAMYRAKQDGLGSFEFHREEMSSPGGIKPATVDVLQHPVNRYVSALGEDDPRLRNMREANGQLVIAALIAQEREAHTAQAHLQQIKFLAKVPHELRNPLSAIRTAAELLNHAHADVPLLERLQVMIKRQVAHMSRLVDDLVDGSRVSTGKFWLERSTVDMGDILSLAVEICRPAMDKRFQHLKMQAPPSPLSVYGDPVRLAQIFSNLLDNASKYTPAGGEIALAVEVFDHAMTITVSDNGIGITAEALPNIFDLFVQDTRTMAFHNGGLGIGLAVVRELVKAHGGTVAGSSAGPDLGSKFVVTLPMPEAPTAALIV
ncbi:MAG: diguanylate cyclase [Burkholderiales bacterium]